MPDARGAVDGDEAREEGESKPPPAGARGWISLGLKLALALGLIVYLWASGGLKGEVLLRLFRSPRVLLITAAAAAFTMLLQVLRWGLLLRAADVAIPMKDVLKLGLLGQFFNTFMPGGVGGDPLRALYVMRHAKPGRRVEAVTTIFLDRVVGLATLCALGVLGVLAQPYLASEDKGFQSIVAQMRERYAWIEKAGWFFAALIATGLVTLLVPRIRRSETLRAIVYRAPGADFVVRAAKTLHRSITAPSYLLSALLLSAVAHGVAVYAFYVIGSSLGHTLSPSQHIYIVPLGMIANALPGPPGGLGVGEFAFKTLYNLALGSEDGVGAETCLVWRCVYMTWSLTGAYVYVAYRRPEHAELRAAGGTEADPRPAADDPGGGA